MVITLGELIELAKLGAKSVRKQSKEGVIAWLGYLPTDTELDNAGQAMGQNLLPDCVPPLQRVVYWSEE